MSPLRRIHTVVVAVCRGRIFITMSWGNDIVPAVPRGGAITMAPGHCDYGASHANGGTSPAWSPCDSLWVALALRHRAGEEEGTGDIYSCCIIRSMLHADMDLHNFWCIHKFRCMFCVLSPVACFAWVCFALSGIIAEFQGHFCAFFFFNFLIPYPEDVDQLCNDFFVLSGNIFAVRKRDKGKIPVFMIAIAHVEFEFLHVPLRFVFIVVFIISLSCRMHIS